MMSTYLCTDIVMDYQLDGVHAAMQILWTNKQTKYFVAIQLTFFYVYTNQHVLPDSCYFQFVLNL